MTLMGIVITFFTRFGGMMTVLIYSETERERQWKGIRCIVAGSLCDYQRKRDVFKMKNEPIGHWHAAAQMRKEK